MSLENVPKGSAINYLNNVVKFIKMNRKEAEQQITNKFDIDKLLNHEIIDILKRYSVVYNDKHIRTEFFKILCNNYLMLKLFSYDLEPTYKLNIADYIDHIFEIISFIVFMDNKEYYLELMQIKGIVTNNCP